MARTDPKPIPALSQKDIERFWGFVDKTPGHGPQGACWLWTGSKLTRNYGSISINRKTIRAHRVSYLLHYGQPPEDKPNVLHRCDNPPCVNPAHLWAGTYADNNQDSARKNRTAKGDKNGARLHPERLARGKKNGAHTHPERRPRGDRSGSRLHPETRARGDRHGSHIHPEKYKRGEEINTAKLTADQVREIRLKYDKRIKQRDFAKQYGISQAALWSILHRKSWKHID